MRVITVILCLFLALNCFSQSIDKSMARVQQVGGLYIFTDCSPVAEYVYLGSVKGANVGLKSPQYDVVRDGLIKKLNEQFPDADGVILQLTAGAKDKADAIKFK